MWLALLNPYSTFRVVGQNFTVVLDLFFVNIASSKVHINQCYVYYLNIVLSKFGSEIPKTGQNDFVSILFIYFFCQSTMLY